MNFILRITLFVSICVYTAILFIPIVVYLIYGIPKYLFTGDSGLADTWLSQNPLLKAIHKLDPDL